jgi:hypothetical protein
MDITEVWHGWKCDACGATWELSFKPDAHTIYDPFQRNDRVPVQCPGTIKPETIVTVDAPPGVTVTADDVEFPPHPADASDSRDDAP